MKLYESRLKVKTGIDQMQIDFECCGSTNYRDWWTVGWWSVRWLDTDSPEVINNCKGGGGSGDVIALATTYTGGTLKCDPP